MAIGLLDQKLLTAASQGMTPDQMEEEFYMPAADAAARVKYLLGQQDVWTEIEQRKLRAHQLQSLYKQIMDYGFNPSDPKMTQALTNLQVAISRVTEDKLKITEEDMNRISATQAKAMLRMIEMAFGRAKELLRDEYPMIDVSEVEAAFTRGLQDAAKEIES